jgi:hypothetical protein
MFNSVREWNLRSNQSVLLGGSYARARNRHHRARRLSRRSQRALGEPTSLRTPRSGTRVLRCAARALTAGTFAGRGERPAQVGYSRPQICPTCCGSSPRPGATKELASQYWIHRNRVTWSRRWSESQVSEARARDRHRKSAFYGERDKAVDVDGRARVGSAAAVCEPTAGVWSLLRSRWRR